VAVEPIAPFLEPVRKTVVLGCPVASAFELFTGGIGRWWPLREGFSISGERAVGCAIERRVGGAVYEIRDDGQQFPWGRVLAWDPPSRLVLEWHPGHDRGAAQEVEVTFTGTSAGTRVDLTHRNWRALGEQAPAVRSRYDAGWARVFEGAFASAAAAL
jgi:uncharacterized protein YndB with AHSA1/START domain